MKPLSGWEDKLRQFAAPIIIIAAAAGLVLGAVVPQIGKIRTDRQTLNDAAAAAAALETKAAVLEAIDSRAQADDLEKAVEAVPLWEPYIQSLRLVETLLARQGMVASQFKVDTENQALSLKFMVSGTMDKIQNFLDDVNRALPVSGVETVEALRLTDGRDYRAAAEIKVYFSRAPTTIGRAGDPLPVMTAQQQGVLKRLNEFEPLGPAEAGVQEPAREPAERLFPL